MQAPSQSLIPCESACGSVEAREDSGVSPLVGSILVLGLSVAGTATALLLGAPVLQRLQEQASLDTMAGQLGAAREAQLSMSLPGDGRSLAVSMPSGSLRLEPGTRWMVTANSDAAYPLCDFRVLAWADGDAEIHLDLGSGATCRTLVGNPPVDCLLSELPVGEATSACLEVYQVDGQVETRLGIVSAGLTRVTLNTSLAADRTYVFRLTDLETAVYAEAWLLPTDRLRWSGGRVALDLEAGALFAHGRAGDRAASPPRVDGGSSTIGPLLVVFPGMQAEHGIDVKGGGTHAFDLDLDASHVRHQGTAYLVRLDLFGDNALPLCAGLQQVSLDALVAWEPDTLDGTCGTTGAEATVPVTQDDTVSLRFDPDDVLAGDLPQFVLTQQVFKVRLQP